MEHFSESEWCIENISCWNEEVHGRSIYSPEFPPLGFTLYPRGDIVQEECMEVNINSSDLLPPGELSFLCSDGSLIHSQQVENPDEYDLITVLGPQLEEVLALIKEKDGDILTLRYRFKSEEENKHQVRTVIDVIDTTFKIDPVALGCGKPISQFRFPKNTETYWVCLDSVREGNVTQIQVEFPDTKDVMFLKTSVKFFKVRDVLEKYEEKEHIFREKEQWVFFSINDREFAERGVAVLLRLKIITGIIHSDPSIYTKGVSIVSNKQESSEIPIVPSDYTDDSVTVLTKDFMCLFQDQDFSDLQLKCGGVSVPVHKNILSARSPVFKRLLSSDMREAASGSVDIEDLDAPTLARFLAFLYTGSVEDLNGESAINLYYAADKYEVSTLKKECVECLCADISIVNVCDILSLADKHGDDQLTEVSRSFILKNYNEVLKSQQWMIFMQSETLLAAKTLTHFAQKDNVKTVDQQ